MPTLLNVRFLERWYFLNFDDSESKRSSKINIYVFLNGIAGWLWVRLSSLSNFNALEVECLITLFLVDKTSLTST